MRAFLRIYVKLNFKIMEENIQYYNTYEENLQREILKMCTSLGMLDGVRGV